LMIALLKASMACGVALACLLADDTFIEHAGDASALMLA
jgi:hypothetical protein